MLAGAASRRLALRCARPLVVRSTAACRRQGSQCAMRLRAHTQLAASADHYVNITARRTHTHTHTPPLRFHTKCTNNCRICTQPARTHPAPHSALTLCNMHSHLCSWPPTPTPCGQCPPSPPYTSHARTPFACYVHACSDGMHTHTAGGQCRPVRERRFSVGASTPALLRMHLHTHYVPFTRSWPPMPTCT